MRAGRNEGKLRCMRKTAFAAIAIFAATPALSMGMQCSEYIRFVDLDIPASIMFDIEAVSEFVTTAGMLEGIAIGIEIARPDLEAIGERTLEYCRENLNADAFEFIKQEIER